LRQTASVPQAQSEIDATSSLLQDFAQLDRRIASFARGGQNLMAADLIFADGRDLSEAALASLDQARSSEVQARDLASATFARRQVFAVAAAAGAALLVAMLLAPLPPGVPTESPARSVVPRPAPLQHEPAELELQGESWAAPRRTADPRELPDPREPAPPEPIVAAAPVSTHAEAVEPAPAAAPAAPPISRSPGTDFANVATLCTDLARVVDTRALPGLLERAASVLDASGIILWIADPDGRELNPIFAQGYPPQLINRLGTIPRDAQNATAAAFRTSLVQTVRTDAVSSGAIAAPLVTGAGCVGVMAAEVRHERERADETLAAAAIVAAQLATLVGPPSARSSRETAGAAVSAP
jgi:hypothetical protein